MAAPEPNPALFAEYAPHDRRPPLGSSDGLEIRVAEPGDLPHLARLTALRQGGSVETHLAQQEKALREMREKGSSLVLVAGLHERNAGYAKAGWFEPPPGAPPNAAPAGWYLGGVIVDPEFRRRLKKIRMAGDQSLGASIRRLRKQRQMTRHDFPGIDPKTLARIEQDAGAVLIARCIAATDVE